MYPKELDDFELDRLMLFALGGMPPKEAKDYRAFLVCPENHALQARFHTIHQELNAVGMDDLTPLLEENASVAAMDKLASQMAGTRPDLGTIERLVATRPTADHLMIRPLGKSADGEHASFLFAMAKNSSVKFSEEVVAVRFSILSGTLQFQNRSFVSGEKVAIENGDVFSTKNGCVAIIQASTSILLPKFMSKQLARKRETVGAGRSDIEG